MLGPDQGKGGKFLLVPPGLHGSTAEARAITSSRHRTYNNLFVIRAFVQDGDLAGTVKSIKAATPALPALGRGQPAGTEIREHLGPQVQHGPRQRLQLLRRAE